MGGRKSDPIDDCDNDDDIIEFDGDDEDEDDSVIVAVDVVVDAVVGFGLNAICVDTFAFYTATTSSVALVACVDGA